MAGDQLTKKQKRLIKELDELCSILALDYQHILDYEKESRSTYLELTKDQIIRSQVIIWYTAVDELLNVRLSLYYFGHKRSSIDLWKTKKFQLFNYYILEELHLMQKLRHVRAIKEIPKPIRENIEKLNTLRNGLAHAFFPQNLKKSKPIYKGKSIFSLEGIKELQEDMQKVFAYFGSAESP